MLSPELRALIWDVDGTLAETERDGHRVAFNLAFDALGLPWHWSVQRYGELLGVTGGVERLLHDMAAQPWAPTSGLVRKQLAQCVHRAKNEHYAQIVAGGHIALRGGVSELLDECTAAGLPMAIATTTSGGNVAALLAVHLGSRWRERFAGVVCAEDAPRKKPDPQVYQLALECLRVQAHEALAIEDSPAGVQASSNAGVPVIAARSEYFAHLPLPGALAVGPGLQSGANWQPSAADAGGRIGLSQLRYWFTSNRAVNSPNG